MKYFIRINLLSELKNNTNCYLAALPIRTKDGMKMINEYFEMGRTSTIVIMFKDIEL
jgi:hypothetical protein